MVAVAIPVPPGDAMMPGLLAAVGAATLATRVDVVLTVGVPDSSPNPHPVRVSARTAKTATHHEPRVLRAPCPARFARRVPCVTLLPLQYPARHPVRSASVYAAWHSGVNQHVRRYVDHAASHPNSAYTLFAHEDCAAYGKYRTMMTRNILHRTHK